MPKTYTPPQPFEEGPAPSIAMTRVNSSQIHSMGYDAATRELAIRFNAPGDRDLPTAERVGADALYVHENFSPLAHADFLSADSLGIYHGQHIKGLPFKKYRLTPADAATSSS